GLPPAVAGRAAAHQPGIEAVLHVAAQHAILDERGALSRGALVVDVQGAAALRQGAVIDDRALRGRDALADAVGECGSALAIEITLQAMADRLVQQDARPAWPEHDGHGPRGRRHGLQIDQGLPRGLARERKRPIAGDELRERVAPAGAAVTLLAPSVLLDQHRHVETYERSDIRC